MREDGLSARANEAWSQWGTVIPFSVPAVLAGLSALPALWVASALVARQPNGLSETALYSAANSFRALVLFVPGVINGVGMSVINHERSGRDARKLRRAFLANLGGVGAATLLGAAAVTAAGPFVLRLYGHTFDAAYTTLLVLLCSTIPEATGMAAYQIVVSNERLWTSLFGIALPRDVTLVALTYALAPRFGALGMAMAYAAAYLIALVATVAWSWHIGLGINVNARLRE
jgi:O-antigen/teichoic acid export membrane protein